MDEEFSATLAKPLSATGTSTLQLSSSRVKCSNYIVYDSDDYLDRDIDEIADAMATVSKPSTSVLHNLHYLI
uniref:Uncharacterized protein n=1 Tax=Quercus lobata TaxID=97700 RepID=A0A7N2LQ29_QUELO